jgi:hypothetical protein
MHQNNDQESNHLIINFFFLTFWNRFNRFGFFKNLEVDLADLREESDDLIFIKSNLCLFTGLIVRELKVFFSFLEVAQTLNGLQILLKDSSDLASPFFNSSVDFTGFWLLRDVCFKFPDAK